MAKHGGTAEPKTRFRETELKLELAPDHIEQLRAHPLVREGFARADPPQDLRSVYFDTPRLALRDAGLSLRIRRIGERRLQTIKAGNGAAVGLFDRDEWEREVQSDAPDLEAATGTALEPLLRKGKLGGLGPVFAVCTRRTTLQVGSHAWSAELTLDQGTVEAGARSLPLCEIELELRQGEPRHLFDLARSLNEAAPLRLGIRAKAERGYDLIAKRPRKIAKASDPGLRPGMGTADAFQAIGRSCLHHFLSNEPVLRAARDPAAVHQMRVALRRLRAAISLFKPVVGDEQRASIAGELKWAANQLGDARDLDVFIADVLGPVQAEYPDDPDLRELGEHVQERRDAAYANALAATDSPRFRSLVLETAAWIETGRWLTRKGKKARILRARPVEDHAAEQLSRRARTVRKRGRHLGTMAAEPRHEVRIAVKKLRYAAEFFGPLYPGKAAAGRRKAFLSALERLQDHLGALNDVAVGQDMGAALAGPADAMGGAERARAAGLVARHQTSHAEGALARALEAYRDFAAAEPFWH